MWIPCKVVPALLSISVMQLPNDDPRNFSKGGSRCNMSKFVLPSCNHANVFKETDMALLFNYDIERPQFLCQKRQSPFPRPMAHRAVPISVYIALGHASANAVKATAGGWSTDNSASLTFTLHSHMSSARRESSGYNF